MVEATPGSPYGGSLEDLLRVEPNMALRRARIAAACPSGVVPLSLAVFPLLGVGRGDASSPRSAPGGPFSASAYIGDALISPHPRFGALTANIRARRGSRVDIRIPLFLDARTVRAPVRVITDARFDTVAWESVGVPAGTSASAFYDAASAAAAAEGGGRGEAGAAATAGVAAARDEGDVGDNRAVHPYIHMDAMAFGMGACCLQTTYQARDIAESRALYDQLAVLAPLLLALSANTPIWRGHLADTDVRWDGISASVDCRTPSERGEAAARGEGAGDAAARAGEALAGGGTRRLAKSRYSSISTYIGGPETSLVDAVHNDIACEADPEELRILLGAGLDERLARHVAYLFSRDPLVIYKGRVEDVDDETSSAHFESLQSTNWRSMRWKPPPPEDVSIGWRIELRTMEVQLTDFENAAFAVFATLLSRVALVFRLNLYMPLSLVDQNFDQAAVRDAARTGRFWFPRKIVPTCGGGASSQGGSSAVGAASVGGGGGGSASTAGESACATSGGEGSGGVVASGGAPIAGTSGAAVEGATSSGGGGVGGVSEMSLSQILMGDGSADFPGLLPLISTYLDLLECDGETRSRLEEYLAHMRARAVGATPTGAAWQRAFVRAHADYKQDSVVTPTIAADLTRAVADLARGRGAAQHGAAVDDDSAAPETRLRGASFNEELRSSKTRCIALRELLAQHALAASRRA